MPSDLANVKISLNSFAKHLRPRPQLLRVSLDLLAPSLPLNLFAQRAIENWSVKLSAFNARQDAAVAEDVDGDGKDAARATATTTSTVRARPDAESELELERELAVFVLTLNEIICDDCALVAVSSRPRRRQTSSQQRAGGCCRRVGGTGVPG